MMKLRIYNTKTLKLEEFKPIKEKEVKMYVCGPTVYDNIHIGNARPVVVFDTLRRLLEAIGYNVKYVSNYTDVDDKIIKRAHERGIDEFELTKEMIAAYNDVRTALNAKDLYKTPKVTETMDDIINFIDELVMNGNAYVKDGDVYFRVASIDDYGSLSHQNLEDLKAGARVEENDKKESPLDFVLWKQTEMGIKWPTKYSIGRPGWHSECVVMIKKELGNLIDIHAGGRDLRFPHHENERAQAKALYNSDLANYWLHNGMLTFGGEKMSKSLGNLVLSKDAIEKHGANTIRWLLLSAQYRDVLSYTEDTINNAKKELIKVINAIKKASLILNINDYQTDDFDQEHYNHFIEAMCDDLNTPNAYTHIFEMVKIINQDLRVSDVDYQSLASHLNALTKSLDVLGITYEVLNLSADDKKLYLDWQSAKHNKDFDQADQLRNILNSKGIL